MRIKKNLKSVLIKGRDLKKDGSYLAQKNPSSEINELKLDCLKQKHQVLLKKSPFLTTLSSSTGLITLGREKYAGELVLLSQKKSSGCDILNKAPLETYLSTLLAKEMNASWPLEALKAQAVAARTYALYKMKKRQEILKMGRISFFDIESSEKNQVSGHFFDATSKTLLAVRETKNQVLVGKNNEFIPIFFHASCGGRTLVPHQVWKNSINHYASVKCPHCHYTKKRNWKFDMKWKELFHFFKWAYQKKYIKFNVIKKKVFSIKLLPDHFERAYFRFYLESDLVTIKKSLLRRYLGRKKIQSNYFLLDLKSSDKFIHITGNGRGHGVGLCQIGSLKFSQQGYDYKKILYYYFPNFKLKTITL